MAKKILVIDDDEGILEAFQAMLESAGYTAITSADPSYLNTIRPVDYPDLILLDVLLSGKDGREICKAIKSQPQTPKIPIIMMSAAPNVEKTVRQAGADDFLNKPFEMKELLDKVAKYVKV